MPAGMQVTEYDILCVPRGQTWASAPLRKVIVPVSATPLDQITPDRRLRGVAVQYDGGPNPITGRGRIGKCIDNETDFTGAQLGLVMRCVSFTVMSLGNVDNTGAPSPIIFRILTGTGGALTVRFTGVLTPQSLDWHEPLIQVSGLNMTQIEIAARVDPSASPAARWELMLAVNITQCDDAVDRVWTGLGVAAGGP